MSHIAEILTKVKNGGLSSLPPEERKSAESWSQLSNKALRAGYSTLTKAERAAITEALHAIHTLGEQFGADYGPTIHQEFGISFLKKLSRGVKSVGKAVVKSPIIKGAAGLVAIVYPPVGVPLTAALAVASKAVSMANSADKKIAAVGKAIIKNTVAQAKTDPSAARAVTLLKKVNTKAKVEATQTPAQKLATGFKKEQVLRKKVKVASAVDKAPKYGGWIITTQGRIIPGTQLLKIAGDELALGADRKKKKRKGRIPMKVTPKVAVKKTRGLAVALKRRAAVHKAAGTKPKAKPHAARSAKAKVHTLKKSHPFGSAPRPETQSGYGEPVPFETEPDYVGSVNPHEDFESISPPQPDDNHYAPEVQEELSYEDDDESDQYDDEDEDNDSEEDGEE